MTPTTIDSPLAKSLQSIFSDQILEITDFRGDLTILIDKNQIHSVAKNLRDHPDLKFEQMMDITTVDYLYGEHPTRFQMVYHFYSLSYSHRVRVKCNIEEEDARLPSIHDLWECVNWYERESYDMYGIHFENHPDLRRILTYEEFEGHPLRKDYNITDEQPLVELLEIPERHNYKQENMDTFIR